MYIIVTSPITLQPERLDGVEIVEVYPDGRFWAKAGPWESHDCNPETNQVFYDDGTPANIIGNTGKTTDEKINELALAVNDAMLAVMMLSIE